MLSNGKERKRKVYANARNEIRMAIDFWREMILMGLLNISRKKPLFVREAFHAKSWREWSKKSSSKAAATLARGAYFQYVSTTKWRERRWRLFSTFP
jgi:hypothetical protein